MDPNKTLRGLIDWATENADTDADAQSFLDLDQWLTKGGFLPDRWKRPALPPDALRAQLRQALHEINQSLHEAESALHDARVTLNIKLPRS